LIQIVSLSSPSNIPVEPKRLQRLRASQPIKTTLAGTLKLFPLYINSFVLDTQQQKNINILFFVTESELWCIYCRKVQKPKTKMKRKERK